MKIISYSDLYLEFGSNFIPPADTDADVMILAGGTIPAVRWRRKTEIFGNGCG
jgi:hypothetical protein